MEYTKLGRTDIEIAKICVGCMSIGKAGTMHDWTIDKASTAEVVRRALDLGVSFLTPPTSIPPEHAKNTQGVSENAQRTRTAGHIMNFQIHPKRNIKARRKRYDACDELCHVNTIAQLPILEHKPAIQQSDCESETKKDLCCRGGRALRSCLTYKGHF